MSLSIPRRRWRCGFRGAYCKCFRLFGLEGWVLTNRYGVSRVYNQQCGYALADVQTMHDRMKSILKVIHGSGLDPAAGKAKYVPSSDELSCMLIYLDPNSSSCRTIRPSCPRSTSQAWTSISPNSTSKTRDPRVRDPASSGPSPPRTARRCPLPVICS